MEEPFRHDERQISECQSKCPLSQAITRDMPHTPEQEPAGDIPKNAPSGEHQRELAKSSNGAWLASGLDEAKQQDEERNRCRVVQQSLAFNQPIQAPWCS